MGNPSQRTSRSGANAETSVAMATAAGLALAAGQCQISQPIRIARVVMTGLVLTHTDAGAAGGYASQKVFDWPQGLIIVLGAVLNYTSIVVTTGIASTSASVVFSAGSAAEATGATLDSTQANIIPSTSTGTLVASAAPAAVGAVTAAAVYLNGTASAAACYLNFAADATDSTANSTITVTGTFDIMYVAIGDK